MAYSDNTRITAKSTFLRGYGYENMIIMMIIIVMMILFIANTIIVVVTIMYIYILLLWLLQTCVLVHFNSPLFLY